MIRRNVPVTEIQPVPQDAEVRIIHVGDGFHLLGGGELLAVCKSAKRLSDYAFEEGALSVRHAYDLKLSDGEP